MQNLYKGTKPDGQLERLGPFSLDAKFGDLVTFNCLVDIKYSFLHNHFALSIKFFYKAASSIRMGMSYLSGIFPNSFGG